MCRCRQENAERVKELKGVVDELRIRATLVQDDDPAADLRLDSIESELATANLAISAINTSNETLLCCGRT